jgi:hypothetical protein
MFSDVYLHIPIIFLGSKLVESSRKHFEKLKWTIDKFITGATVCRITLLNVVDLMQSSNTLIPIVRELIEYLRIHLLSGSYYTVHRTITLV